jgi:hypothetical protein
MRISHLECGSKVAAICESFIVFPFEVLEKFG